MQNMLMTSKDFDPCGLKVWIGTPRLGNEVHMFRSRGFEIVENLADSDIVVFTGGADISPALYGEKLHQRTSPSLTRDANELQWYRQSRGKFRFGICRGGQLLNVLSGGKLWQHIDNHHGDHEIRDCFTGQKVMATSVHHQSFRPGKSAVVVAVTKVSSSKEAQHDSWKKGQPHQNNAWETDYEVLFYPDTRSLALQFHPEFRNDNSDPLVEYTFQLLSRYYPLNDQRQKVV